MDTTDSTPDISSNLESAAMAAMSIRNLAKQLICEVGNARPDDAAAILTAISALAEKCGYICDEAIKMLGSPGSFDGYDAWAALVKI